MHRITLSCRQTGASLGASLYVQGAEVEPVGRPARPEVLEEIARVTRGTVLPPGDLAQLLDYLSDLPDRPPSVRRVPLWSNPGTGALLVLLLGGLWVARKIVGLI